MPRSVPVPLQVEPSAVGERLRSPRVPADGRLIERLRSVCARVDTEPESTVEAARDWWPITLGWATAGDVPALPFAVARPTTPEQVAHVLAACDDARVPVTAMAGRSGVCGASIPAFGGVALDLCSLSGVVDLDTTSLLARVLPGTFGPDLEAYLQPRDTTLGHWPQSVDISTVGGWLACRSAGQYSTRYGKIEDMVVGLEVALADGRTIRTGGAGPRTATGPDLTQLFVGSEGTLGVITSAILRVRPRPPAEVRRAFGFRSFNEGLEACRGVLRRGATPAVLRLYDLTESARNFGVEDHCVLIVLDEADPALLACTSEIVDAECTARAGVSLEESLVSRWMEHRNDVSALGPLYQGGIVVDTIEISARWGALGDIYERCTSALQAVEGTLVASAHQSHSYWDGACLYFTFAGRGPDGANGPSSADPWAQRYYVDAWNAVMDVVIASGGAISHHHGIGINRARFMTPALGESLGVLASVKDSLDPRGILNPGKLGLPSPFGEIEWP
jgi:alkyldihydroxyacetonephosphate synthase